MKKIKARHIGERKSSPPPTHHSEHRVRTMHLAEGLPTIQELREELADYWDVLMGREEPPIKRGIMTMYEVADAYYSRAAEITYLIQQAELEGTVLKGSAWVRFRTGEVRTFMDAAKRAADLGSRRLSHAQLEFDMERLGRESV